MPPALVASRLCPDAPRSLYIAVDGGSELLHPQQSRLPTTQGGLPAPPLAWRLRRKREAGTGAKVRTQVHVGEEGGAGGANLTGPRLLGEDSDLRLERGGPDVVEAG